MKKRVCLVLPALQVGGMERVMSELAGYFCQKSDIDVHMILYGRMPEIFYNVPANLIIHTPVTIFKDKLRPIYTIGRLYYLRRTIRKIYPDTILSFGELWNSFVLLAVFGSGFHVFISDRCQPDKRFNRIHSFLRNWLYPKSKGIIAQSGFARDIFFKQFNHANISVIGNPVNLPAAGMIQGENIILTVGRLINTKHHDRQIQIFSKLKAQGWKLVIVGGNALKQNNFERLQHLTEEMNLTDRVIFTNEVSNVYEYYLKSKIFTFTSSSEGFPNVVGEALASGLPVISYDCVTSISELVKDGENGFLVPGFDDVEFQKKLQLLIDNEDMRNKMSISARESIKRFSVESIGQQYLEFILS